MNIYSNWSHPVKIRKGASQYSFTSPVNVASNLTTNPQTFLGGGLYNGKYYFLDATILKSYDLITSQVNTIPTTGDTIYLRSNYTRFLYPISISKTETQMCLFLVGGNSSLDIDHTSITMINLVTFVVTNYISTVGSYYSVAEILEEDGLIISFGKTGTSTSYIFNIDSGEFSTIPDPPIDLVYGTCALNALTSEIIFIGGIKESTMEFPAEVLSFSLDSSQYSYKAGKPHLPAIYLKNGIKINNDIIVSGGNSSNIYKFSLSTNSYSQISSIHELRNDCAQFLYNNKLYYTDGSNTQSYCNDIWSIDLTVTCS